MIIGIDGNEANNPHRVGIGQYAFEIIKKLYQLDTNNSYLIFLKSPLLPDMPPASTRWQYIIFGPQKFWTRFALPLKLAFASPKLDLFFSPSHYTPLFTRIPTICSIMDLGYLHYPNQLTAKDLYQLTHWTAESIKKSRSIITISQFTKNELISRYKISPTKITIAYPGVETPHNIPHNSTLPKKYFLSLGTLKPSKNIPFLIDAFAKFSPKHPDYHLIIAGKKGWLFDEIFATVKKNQLESKVIFQDYISADQKWPLLKQATALVIPSLYEGFGIPAIEAMSVGTPVIASSAASLPEIIENYGLIIDPANTDSLVHALNKVIEPKIYHKLSLLGKKRALDFTWEKAAKNIIKVFHQL